MVPNATPKTEMMEITLIKFFFLGENRYRPAMKNEVFRVIGSQ